MTVPLAAAAWVKVWLILGLVLGALMVGALTQLGRHALVLSRTLKRFQEEVQPLAEDISRESDKAADASSRLRRPGFHRS